MRAIWKGAITFGLVTIPVKLYPATESRDIQLRMLCPTHHAPIQEKRVCSEGGEELEWKELTRGVEVATDEFVELEPDEIESAKPESSTTVDIGDFVEANEIDPIHFEKSYFLEPTDVGAKAFSLLRRALQETERVAIARVTIRTRERLATVRPYDDTLLLETMFWPDEIRSTGALDLPEGEESKVRPKELQMAESLVTSLADRFDPDAYTDAYRSALEELIEQKTRGASRKAKRRKPAPKVIDLMEALQASVAEAKKGGIGTGTAKRKSAPARKARRKRRAA